MINIPFLCVFLAFALTYLIKVPVAIAMAQFPGGYNNFAPRSQQEKLTGWGRRALSAHLNSFEVFPAFAAAVIMAHLAAANEKIVTILCITFLLSRVIYVFLYLSNHPMLRSSVWMLGMICITAIFVMAL